MFNYVTTLVLDKMGRIVIPAKVREGMGLEKGCALVLSYDGNNIKIEKVETKK